MADKEKARALFEEAQKISWGTRPPNVPHRAIELAEAALAEDPDFIKAAALLANDLRRANNYEKSIELYKYAIARANDIEPDNHKQLRNLLRDLGRVLVLAEKYEEATNYLEKSIEIEYTSASEYLAEAYNKLGRHQDVIDLYSHIEQMSENGRIVDEPALHLGRAYKALGNNKKAKSIFEAGLLFNPANDDIKAEMKNMGGGCFIATAAFGSEFAPEVLYLRQFRDSVILKHDSCRTIIDFYYFVSPSCAQFISRYLWLRSAVRKLIILPFIRALRLFYK